MRRRNLLRSVALLGAVLAGAPALAAQDGAAAPTPTLRGNEVAVIYPRVREPFRSVFRTIAGGIGSEIPGSLRELEVDPAQSAGEITAQLKKQDVRAVVLLGKHGLDLSRAIDGGLQRSVGAVFATPGDIPPGVSAVSFAPSPRRLFETLRSLAPGVKRITVIHDGATDDWLIGMAGHAATELGYTLQPIRYTSMKDGANAYREVMDAAQPPTDAVWLLQASKVLEETQVLQMILRTAWDRNIVVFSSNPSHVPKGVLFALFPDNQALGRQLGRMVLSPPPPGDGLRPLEQLDTAINIKMADHLGLGLDAKDTRFKMVFPSR